MLTVDDSFSVGIAADTRKSRSQGQRQTIGGTKGTVTTFIQQVDNWRIET